MPGHERAWTEGADCSERTQNRGRLMSTLTPEVRPHLPLHPATAAPAALCALPATRNNGGGGRTRDPAPRMRRPPPKPWSGARLQRSPRAGTARKAPRKALNPSQAPWGGVPGRGRSGPEPAVSPRGAERAPRSSSKSPSAQGSPWVPAFRGTRSRPQAPSRGLEPGQKPPPLPRTTEVGKDLEDHQVQPSPQHPHAC